jgi:hypothetical protein
MRTLFDRRSGEAACLVAKRQSHPLRQFQAQASVRAGLIFVQSIYPYFSPSAIGQNQTFTELKDPAKAGSSRRHHMSMDRVSEEYGRQA